MDALRADRRQGRSQGAPEGHGRRRADQRADQRAVLGPSRGQRCPRTQPISLAPRTRRPDSEDTGGGKGRAAESP
eukprot:7835926-Pyramimonas_sp.AAC.1